MKKLLLTLIVTLAFCGSIFAQYSNPNGYTSHWASASYNQYSFVDYPCFFVKIDGHLLTFEDDWQDLEFASFVNGTCRGHDFMTSEYLEYGWPYPLIEGLMIKYEETGDTVTFKMYNHATQTEYNFGVGSIPILTGVDHIENWMIYPEEFDEAGEWEERALFMLITTPAQEGYTLEIDQYTSTKDNYYLISSPVGAVTAEAVEGLMTPSYDFYSFAQTTEDGKEWINHRDDAEFELQPGVGYLYANNTGTDLTFYGNPVVQPEEEFELALAYDAGAEFAGWNLVGNPYAENEAYILCRPFYLMSGETFELIPEEANQAIAPMTGAFVVAEEEGEYVTFTANPGAVQCEGLGEDKIVLNVSNGRSLIDRVIVRFGEGRQLPKFQLRESSTKVYIPMEGKDYAIVNSANQGELPVNFKAEKSGTYTLTINAETMGMNYLHLIDNLTGADTDLLANSSYTFDASTTDYASRFKLVFATGESDDTFAFASNGSFVISNEGNATVQVIDINGRILSSKTINGSANINVNAAPGVYMIRLINGENVKVQKVVVK